MGWKALFGGGAAFHKLFRTAPGKHPLLPQSEVLRCLRVKSARHTLW
jgi:hypothetical protein